MPEMHPRYDYRQPLLRELVSVCVWPSRYVEDSFRVRLTRIPGVGEEVLVGADSYRITRVQHDLVDNDGRARLGEHAYVEAVLMPPDPPLPRRRKAFRLPRRRGKSPTDR
ncbi:hypothetical protein PHYC_03847 [Phycisphaerales bacterium]|nr:hypothetical protein PHYC_03847 [Phycisphaerales bacterium]